MNDQIMKRIFNSNVLRWVGIITILGLALSACEPSTAASGTPGAETTGTAGGLTTQEPGSTTGTPGGSNSSTGTESATTAATTAETMAPTTAATTASTSAATATSGSNVGSGGSTSGTPPVINATAVPSQTQVYVLVDGAGMTLYEYAKDTANTSTCDAACLANWPPLLAGGTVTAGTGLNSSDFGTTQTTDGRTMVTYRGFPLYYFKGDQNPGDMKGYGVGGLWTVVAVPAPQNAMQGTATPTP